MSFSLMIPCATCERPLICDACKTDFVPASEAEYRALSQIEYAIFCRKCGAVLVCHWCKEPYDGKTLDEPGDQDGDRG
jgi:hypothetical protein